MQTTVTSKGQLTLPIEVRKKLGIDAGTVLELEFGGGGTVVLKKRATPGFFDQFVGLKAAGAPYASGDEAREELRVAEDGGPVPSRTGRSRRKRR